MNSVKSRGDLTLKKALSPAAAVLALIVVGLIPSFNPGPQPAYLTIVSVTIVFYVVMSVSWNIFSGPTGYVSLASAAFYGVGIYTSVMFGNSLPLPALMLIGGVASFVLALLVGAITLRLRGVYFTIFTFGLVQLLISLVLWYEVKVNNVVVRTVESSGYNTVFYCLFILMVLTILAAFFIKRSRFGMALTSIGECEDAAAHVGVNTTLVKVIAFAVTAFAMGAAGAARATTMISIKPEIAFNVLESFLPVLMVIFGGSRSILGPIVGAVVFSVLKEQLITKWPKWYMIIFGTVMVLAILLLPNGIIGAIREIPGIVKKLLLLLLTLIFAGVGYVFNLILAVSGVGVSGLVFALLFGIVGFIISVHLLKYLMNKRRKGGRTMRILEAIGLNKAFGGLTAVSQVDINVNEGEILGLIGPNGAGKTTLFNLLSGAYTLDSGTVLFKGVKISGMKPNQICRLGIGPSFQAAKNFAGMPVRQNVMMGALFGKQGISNAQASEITDEVLRFVGLYELRDKMVPDIPLAHQKRLEVARALATQPKLLLLDEVMAGLNPSEVGEAMELVTKIRGSGITIIMIEHVMKAIMSICDRIVVLHHGAKLAEGSPQEISTSKAVIEVYLGEC